MSHNFEGCIGTQKNAVTCYQHHRIKVFRSKSVLLEQLLAYFRLQGCKTKIPPTVAFQYPLHGSIAKIAYPIE